MQWFQKRSAAAKLVDAASGSRKRRTRAGVFVALAALLSSLVVAVSPSAASAGNIVPCPAGITEWRQEGAGRAGFVWYGYRYTLVSATPRFAVSDGRAFSNDTDVEVPWTVTSEVSQTYQISATVGVNATLVKDFLTANVSTNITQSRTTRIGVSFNVTIPPRTRMVAEYGVQVYDVNYYIEAWRYGPTYSPGPSVGARCEEWGYYPQSTVAPTVIEEWRLRVG